MLNYRQVYQIYDNCLNWAVGWLEKHGYAVNRISIAAKQTDEGDVIITTTEPLHFRNWPYRGAMTNKTLDILASVYEVVSLQDERCKEATLCVSYFRIEGKKAIAVESLHYDYLHPPQDQHPICHVQNCNDVLGTLPNSFEYDVERSAIEKRCQNVRIPSAFVNLPGLFAILAADHISETHWPDFMNRCLVHFRKIPAMAEHAVVNQAKEGLCAWDWYKM